MRRGRRRWEVTIRAQAARADGEIITVMAAVRKHAAQARYLVRQLSDEEILTLVGVRQRGLVIIQDRGRTRREPGAGRLRDRLRGRTGLSSHLGLRSPGPGGPGTAGRGFYRDRALQDLGRRRAGGISARQKARGNFSSMTSQRSDPIPSPCAPSRTANLSR